MTHDRSLKRFGLLYGSSVAMSAMYRQLERVAGTDATVLLEGESGTGKELVARALHEQSDRRGGNFVPINCAAIPKDLIESELFGHEKGSFTDAKVQKKGLLELAEGSADGERSLIWRQAFHRRTTIQAVLLHLIAGDLTGH